MIPTSLLLPEKPEGIRRLITDIKISWIEIFERLDGQKPESVVFVGFGSECKLSKDHVHKIAYGLELSMLPFNLYGHLGSLIGLQMITTLCLRDSTTVHEGEELSA